MYGESRSQPGNAGRLIPLNPEDYKRIVFFTGAGMSAECGVPTYRGKGGIWDKYNWEEVACQSAFERNPEDVLQFHELRRRNVQKCKPHAGHAIISNLQKSHSNVVVITQNIDGMHQLSGSEYVIELHGSLWRLRCLQEGKIIEDRGKYYNSKRCDCGAWLRPDIIWFGDNLNRLTVEQAYESSGKADLFISIGTSGQVWPAAGIPRIARKNSAFMIEINPEETEVSYMFEEHIRELSSTALRKLFNENNSN